MATQHLVRATRQAGVLTLTLADPRRRNALSVAMVEALRASLAADCGSGADRSSTVVLRGDGGCFSSGHDLQEITAARDDEAALRKIFEACGELMRAVREHPVPIIAAITGPAYAAGCELAASADIVVADEASAKFATPGVRLGLFCHTPAVALVRALGGGAGGARRAGHMLYTGLPVGAAAAASLGLVHELAPAGGADAAAQRIAHAIAGWPVELQDIVLLLVVCARINRPFIFSAHLHCPHCCDTIAR